MNAAASATRMIGAGRSRCRCGCARGRSTTKSSTGGRPVRRGQPARRLTLAESWMIRVDRMRANFAVYSLSPRMFASPLRIGQAGVHPVSRLSTVIWMAAAASGNLSSGTTRCPSSRTASARCGSSMTPTRVRSMWSYLSCARASKSGVTCAVEGTKKPLMRVHQRLRRGATGYSSLLARFSAKRVAQRNRSGRRRRER